MSGYEHSSNRNRLGIALAITSTILLAEILGAWLTGSLALLVDAAHMLTDAGGLLLALFTANLVTKPANTRRTWGYGRAEVLSTSAQATVLLEWAFSSLLKG